MTTTEAPSYGTGLYGDDKRYGQDQTRFSTTYTIRFIPGNFSTPAALYGSGNYGDASYGQETVEPLGSLTYVLRPAPGATPNEPGWLFRQADTGSAWVGVIGSGAGRLSVTDMVSAELVLDEVRLGLTDQDDRPLLHHVYPLNFDPPTDTLNRQWRDGDLDYSGAFRTTVVIIFQSGKRLTVPADDRALTIIRESAFT